MSFLAPAFLIAGLLVGVPILLHWIRRSESRPLDFSAVRFLRPDPPPTHRRWQPQDLLLLLLRIAIVVMVVLAFARPFRPAPAKPGANPRRQHNLVLMLDVSASMRRAGVWEEALAQSELRLHALSPDDRCEVRVFDEHSRVLLAAEAWDALPPAQRTVEAIRRIQAVKPGWLGTHLGRALSDAVDSASSWTTAGAGPGWNIEREVCLISDFQSGARLDGLQGRAWDSGWRVREVRVGSQAWRNNLSLAFLADAGPVRWTARTQPITVRIRRGPGDPKPSQASLQWSSAATHDPLGSALRLELGPDSSRVISLPRPLGRPTGEGWVLTLTGDEVTFDNQLFRVATAGLAGRIDIDSIPSVESPDGLLFFLKQAFPDGKDRAVQLILPGTATSGSQPTPESASGYLIVADSLAARALDRVQARLQSGGTVLWVLTDPSAASSLSRVLGREVSLEEVRGDDGIWATVDYRHPLFQPFADGGAGDFSRLRFRRHRALRFPGGLPPSADWEVPAAFGGSGDAGVAIASVGSGKLVVLTSGWHPADGSLGTSTKFLPLLLRLLEWSSSVVPDNVFHAVGDPVDLSRLGSGSAAGGAQGPWRITLPDAGMQTVDGTIFVPTAPGIYQAINETTQLGRAFSVNLIPEESRLEPMAPDELIRLGVPGISTAQPGTTGSPPVASVAAGKDLSQEDRATSEASQRFWWKLIAGAAVLLMVETLLNTIMGWRTTLRTPPPANVQGGGGIGRTA